MATTDTPLVVVTVGTDHHPFTRLIGWMDTWSAAHPEVRCVVQHGMSPPPTHAEAITIVPRSTMLELMGAATAVVAQAGPGSILDARRAGIVPIAVPRLSHLGEVVDDHQVAFAAAMQRLGDAILASSRSEVEAALEAVFDEPDSVRRAARPSPADDTASQIGDELAATLARPRVRLSPARVGDLLGRRQV